MGIESTHRISRSNAIWNLRLRRVEVFDCDSNERLGYELYKIRDSIFENYEVVDFEEEDEPENNKANFWKYSFGEPINE